jgi:D-alanine transaminase
VAADGIDPNLWPRQVLLGDTLVPAHEARISPFDRGFLFGDGVYEMVRVFDRVPLSIHAHQERLATSLLETGISGFDASRYSSIVDQLLIAEDLRDACVYLQVTRGCEIPRQHVPHAPLDPTIFAYAVPSPSLADLTGPVSTTVILRPDDRWQRCDLKTIGLLPNVMAAALAIDAGSSEAVLHRDGLISEGSHSNVLASVDGAIVTPQVGAFRGILPGTMLALAIESARAAGIPVECRPLSVSEFLRADEIAITSSRRILHSISAIDGRSLPGGPLFTRLFDRMIDSIAAAVAGEPTAAAR